MASDTGATGSSDWQIAVSVPCAGCTLTPGYWKTHSSAGPAPFDDAWDLLPEGAQTPFFTSGQSYLKVLWTPPRGNAWYVLAHAWAAATLNGLNGASLAAIQPSYANATAVLSQLTPTTVPKTARASMLQLATTLDDFNNGLVGPGHCDE